MFHLAAYGVATGGASTNQDMTAAVDPEFSQRNSHYIFSEPYGLIAEYNTGATLTDMRMNVPHINMFARHHFWPQARSLTIPSNPQVDDYRSYPINLPMNEEIAIENTDTASEQVNAFLWLGTQDWRPTLARGIQRLTVLCTQNVTTVANAWGGLTNLTFAENLRGGVYSINGAECFAAASLAFRLVFPRRPLYQNVRKTRPGTLCQQARGDAPVRFGRGWLGEWGRFHTFEPPQIEVWANAAATVSHVLALDVTYLGEDISLLMQQAA